MFGVVNHDKEWINAIHNSLAVIEFSPDGKIITANENFLRTMGYTLAELHGQSHSLFVDTEYTATPEYQQFWEALRAGEIQQSDFPRRKRNGELIWLQASYAPVCARNGKVTKIIKFASDITSRKIMLSDYTNQIQALQRSQAVIEFNLDGTVITANQNFLSAVGYELSEVMGRHHSIFVDASYRESDEYRQFWNTLRTGQFFSGEYRRIGKNGKEIWISATYNPIFDSQGKLYKVVKFASDITALVQANQRNRESKARIDTSLAEISRALSHAAKQSSNAAGASSQTSANVQTVASAAEEMNASVGEIAMNMNRSRAAVDSVYEQVQSADESTQRMVKTAQAMTGIISLIQDIAGQINLLALNATIESARAGDAGKGFAVVASEVKNLAGQTAKATEQIAQEIEGIQTVSREAVQTFTTIRESITQVREYVTSVASAIEEQSAVMREISSNMQVAAQGIESVNHSMSEIVHSTEAADEATQQVLQASLSLAA